MILSVKFGMCLWCVVQVCKALSPSVNTKLPDQPDQPNINQADQNAQDDQINQSEEEVSQSVQYQDSEEPGEEEQDLYQDQTDDDQHLRDEQEALDREEREREEEQERWEREEREEGEEGEEGEESSIQVLDGNIAVGTVPWHNGVKPGHRRESRGEEGRRGSAADDPAFDSACSVASFQILVTEEVMQRTAEAMSNSGLVLPTDTQETVRKMALMKTE